MSIPEVLLALVIIWISALIFGEVAERLGQPAVLGELVGGLVVGIGGLGWIDPNEEIIRLFAEIGVLLLLLEIGLETKLRSLLETGGAATAVALTGMALPFAAGYAAAAALGAEPILAVFFGATLTATSVGVTARVLRDLGRLDSPEARVILGAAIIDDVLGLVLLTLVTGVLAGGEISAAGALGMLAIALFFLCGSLLLGRVLIPRALRVISRMRVQGVLMPAAVALAFSLALLAQVAGSATIIGAFAAGLILGGTGQRREIEEQVRPIAHLFVPVFFVVVGAQVDLRPFNPLQPESWPIISGVLVLSLLAVVTKWVAGLAPFWLPFRKSVIGAGMVPRGEVGLIFAQVGRSSGLLSEERFSALVLIVMITTFVAPVMLRRLLSRESEDAEAEPPGPHGGVEELVTGVE